VEELDDALDTLWENIQSDTRVVFCADHGELLGEDGMWGHPGEMRPELLNVPFGTKNAPQAGEVVSLIDVPTILRDAEHGQGTLDRDVAYATYGEQKAAMSVDTSKTLKLHSKLRRGTELLTPLSNANTIDSTHNTSSTRTHSLKILRSWDTLSRAGLLLLFLPLCKTFILGDALLIND